MAIMALRFILQLCYDSGTTINKEVATMPRPKGSKNKKPSQPTAVAVENVDQISDKIAAVEG